MKKKILFLIHDLGQGGAEKVLINLVNNMDNLAFDITVMTLFDSGENRQFISPKIKYKTWCSKMIPGNSHLMKLLSPTQLHCMIIKEHYDIEVAYLEGPCARIISGCSDPSVKLVSWIHIEQHTAKKAASSFRNIKEARKCYSKFNKIVCVSNTVKADFVNALQVDVPYEVLYNTNESEKIKLASKETVTETDIQSGEIKIIGVGKLLKNKGFDRILRIAKKLRDEKLPIHVYILGDGPEKSILQQFISENKLEKQVTLLGYQLNPYKFISQCDLFVCASHAEGFSTAATEALILGVPVCTVEVSGMKEMLGDKNEYGIIVKNTEQDLYLAIKQLISKEELSSYYKKKAIERGACFDTDKTVRAAERMLLSLGDQL